MSMVLLMAVAPAPQLSSPAAPSQALSCISSNGNARIVTNVTGTPKSIRVYFKGEGGKSCGEYFVNMNPSSANPAQYSALLPAPDPATTAVSFQVRIDYGDGKVVTQPATTVPVTSSCAAPSLTTSELRTAKNIVLGLTNAEQPQSPCSFRCNGITAVLLPNNVLKPNEACRQSLYRRLVARGGGGSGAAGITPVGVVATTAAVIAGGFAFAASRNGSRDRQVSPSRP